MRKHLSEVLTTCLGLCAGFAFCYICLVLPHRERRTTAPTRQQVRQHERITITIARDGTLSLGSEQLDLSQLAARLKELGAQQTVTIRADVITVHGRLEEVVDACKAAAVSRISFATATVQ